MRFLIGSTILAAALAAMPAAAQTRTSTHVSTHGSTGGQWHGSRGGQWQWRGGDRWGGRTGGHWNGGMRAPGGWAAYHRPYRGWRLPRYWIAPSFYIYDWSDYGLAQPPSGYLWSRYYDDAVLVDRDGRVYDSVGDVDWGDDADYAYDDGPGYDDDSADYDDGAGYPLPSPDRPPPVRYGPPAEVVQPIGPRIDYPPMATTCVAGCGGVVASGYYYAPAGVTTVTVATAPVIETTTTTTTEYIEERAPVRHARRAVYRAPVKAHKWHRRAVRRSSPAPRCYCK